MQFQSDIIAKPVLRPVIRETTALGAAYLAGLASGFWHSKEELASAWQCDREFIPDMDEEKRTSLLEGWHTAVGQTTYR